MFIGVLVDEEYHVKDTIITNKMTECIKHIHGSINSIKNEHPDVVIDGSILLLRPCTKNGKGIKNYIRLDYVDEKGKNRVRMWNLRQC